MHAAVNDKLNSLLTDSIPAESILTGVEKAGYVLSSADLAQLAGCDLAEAQSALVSLSGMTGADLKVNDDGDVTYLFPANFREVMKSSSFKASASTTFNKYKPFLVYAAKVSFGVALVASLVTIFATITVITSSSSSDDRDDRRSNRRPGGGGMMYNNIFGPSPFDVFYYRPYRSYYVYGYPKREEMGFLEGCFSYIFGDGDPNAQLEEVRIRSAAEMIRRAGGAVTSEQLAPFADVPADASGDSAYLVDESFVTPLVAALEGRPEVTPDGDIVYVFPELMKSGLRTTKLTKLMGVSSKEEYDEAIKMREGFEVPREVEEVPYSFSAAGSGNLLAAGVLGAVNLGGALYLRALLNSPAMFQVKLGGYFGLVQAGFPLLLGYAVLFNAIPLVRFFWQKGQNAKIFKRNRVRRAWRTTLEAGGEKVRRKLRAAKGMSTSLESLSGLGSRKKTVFDTTKTGSEMQVDDEQRAMEEFDKKLRGGGE